MAICEFCKNHFTKKHNAEKYCSDYCRKEARKEQNRFNSFTFYHRHKHEKSEDEKFGLGSGWLSEHKNPDEEKEMKSVRNERKRLGI